MNRTTQKNKLEKIKEIIQQKTKADYDIILYWHYISVKDEIKEDIAVD